MRGALSNGDQIRTARANRGLTQEQLATLADVDVKTVRKAEQGKRLDVGTLARLALALQIDVNSVVRAAVNATAEQIARRTVVEKWQAAWDARDNDALLDLYHDQAQLHLPGGRDIPFSGTHRGKDGIGRAQRLAWSTAQTVPQKPADYSLITAGDTVVLHGVRGLRSANGESVWLSNIHIFRFEGDRIIDHRVEYDTLGFRQAIDLPPRAQDA